MEPQAQAPQAPQEALAAFCTVFGRSGWWTDTTGGPGVALAPLLPLAIRKIAMREGSTVYVFSDNVALDPIAVWSDGNAWAMVRLDRAFDPRRTWVADDGSNELMGTEPLWPEEAVVMASGWTRDANDEDVWFADSLQNTPVVHRVSPTSKWTCCADNVQLDSEREALAHVLLGLGRLRGSLDRAPASSLSGPSSPSRTPCSE